MEEDVCEAFLESLINLTTASRYLPPDVQQMYLMFDPTYKLQSQYESEKTFALLRFLIGYVTHSEPSNDPSLIDCDVSDAIDTLLSDGFDFLDIRKRPPPRRRAAVAETKKVNGIDVIYSNNIQRPPRFLPWSGPKPELRKRINPFPSFQRSLARLMDPNRVWLITETRTLERISVLMNTCDTIFVSVELHRVHTYRPFPCLISLFFGEKVYIVDILSIRTNCACLRQMFAEYAIVKVIFDAATVLPILWETLGIVVNSFYDPLAAFKMTDIRGSYEDILVHCNESPERIAVDWRIRPMTSRMIMAAAYKVWKLPTVAHMSQKDIVPQMLVYWMNEEVVISFEPPGLTAKRADEIVNAIMQKHNLKTYEEKRIVLELVKWRDAIAQVEDECCNFILPDSAIGYLAVHRPRTVDEFDACEMQKTPMTVSYRNDICVLIRKALGDVKKIDM